MAAVITQLSADPCYTSGSRVICSIDELNQSHFADQDTEIDSDCSSYVSEVRDDLLFSSEKELATALGQSGIDVRLFGEKSAKSLKDLFWEIHKRECKLQWENGRLERYVRVLRIVLHADTTMGPKVLMEKCEQIGSRKRDLAQYRRYIMKKFYFGEDDDEVSYQAVALHNLCGLSEKSQRSNLEFMHREEREEGPFSSLGYPGLMTHYVVIERHLRITNPRGECMQTLGLPLGLDFTCDEEAVPLWRRHFWTWVDDVDPEECRAVRDLFYTPLPAHLTDDIESPTNIVSVAESPHDTRRWQRNGLGLMRAISCCLAPQWT